MIDRILPMALLMVIVFCAAGPQMNGVTPGRDVFDHFISRTTPASFASTARRTGAHVLDVDSRQETKCKTLHYKESKRSCYPPPVFRALSQACRPVPS